MTTMSRLLAGARWAGAGAVGPMRRLVASRSLTTLFVVALVTLGALFYIWLRVRTLELVDRVSRLEIQNREYRDLLMKTDAQISDLARVGRITALATDSLGLAPAPLENLYAVTLPERAVGDDAFTEMLTALRKPFDVLPTVESNDAVAQELFDKPR